MTQVETGNTVKVHYTGTFDDGTQFDTSVGAEPLEVTIGKGEVIPGFERGLEGMGVGDKKTVHLSAEEAYGEHRPELVQEVDRTEIPEEIELAVGVQLQANGPDGNNYVLAVTEVNDATITVDGNHPLAGKALHFELDLVDIAP